MRPRHAAVAILTLTALATAQDPSCAGNGQGAAFLRSTNAVLGQNLLIELGSPNAAGSFGALLGSERLGPSLVPDPRVGTVCIDIFAPATIGNLYALDGTGSVTLSFPIPASATNLLSSPFYITGLAFEGTGPGTIISISRTSRVSWETADGYQPALNTMQEARSMHAATALYRSETDARNQVLITGGGGGNFVQPVGTNTTELFDPLTRTFTPGPNMNYRRASHQSVLLDDGRVFVCGGADDRGIGLATAEIFDPATSAWSLVSAMNAPRIGHQATVLNDGRVLVTGGFATFQNGATNFLAVLNSAQDSAEIYDPATNAWTPLPVMASARAGHAHVALQNGEVLVISGVDGGFLVPIFNTGAPTYTATVERFDPTTNTFAAEPPLNEGRGFFGATRLVQGVVVAGGNTAQGVLGSSIPDNTVELLTGGVWTQPVNLGQAASFATLLARPDGQGSGFSVHGGIVDLVSLAATGEARAHNTVNRTTLNPLGTNTALPAAPAVAVGLHTATLLQDGSYLFVGGTDALTARNDAWIYQPR